jgi:hypothetical protein
MRLIILKWREERDILVSKNIGEIAAKNKITNNNC